MTEKARYWKGKKPCPKCNKLIAKKSKLCCSCNQGRMKKPDEEKLEVKRNCARKYSKARDIELKQKISLILGDKCVRCGFNDPRALHIDHVYNDGYKDRKSTWNTLTKFKAIMNDSTRFQILCANCNFIKMHEAIIKRTLDRYGKALT